VTEPIGVAVVGYGYWGPNLARNVSERPELRLVGLCESDPRRRAEFLRRHPSARVDEELDALVADPQVEAVLVATPPHTHFAVARTCLEAGKHVLVEKPLARSAAEAATLISLAEERERVLMPGHTFVYSPAVNKVRELIRADELGEVYFVTSSRMNLGKYQRDGVVCDLAPHDLSILAHWLGEPLTHVAATGRSVFQKDVPETAFLTLTFAGGAKANVQLSWLAPRKVRQMVVVGSRRMVQYDDTAADESLRVYDRGLDFEEPPPSFGEYRLTYRSGDMVAPRVEAAEPLGLELQDFAAAIRDGSEPRSNAALGLQIVLALEALQVSLDNRGEPIRVPSADQLLDARSLGHELNGNGTQRRRERRCGERRVANLGPPDGIERRKADRRMRDRRGVAVG
jgi:predicted dehydrogenase